MKKTAFFGLLSCALIAAVTVPPTAAAKQVTALRVCGASECKEVSDPAKLRVWLDGGFEETLTAPAGSYYRITMGWGEGERTLQTTHTAWLPAAHLIRAWGSASGRWWRLSEAQHALLRETARGIDPLKAGSLPSTAGSSTSSSSGGSHTGLYAGLGAGLLAALALAALLGRKRLHNGRREP